VTLRFLTVDKIYRNHSSAVDGVAARYLREGYEEIQFPDDSKLKSIMEEEGCPDICLKGKDGHKFVEVKRGSGLERAQMIWISKFADEFDIDVVFTAPKEFWRNHTGKMEVESTWRFEDGS